MNSNPLAWLPVPGYNERYFVSDQGDVKSIHINQSGMLVKARIDRAGYVTVRLNKGGATSTCFVHRLVAAAFIPNPEGYPIVNHINGNKSDNCRANLEWTNHAGNMLHAYNTGLISQKRKERKVVDIRTGRTYNSVREAAGQLQTAYPTCKNYLNGNRHNPTPLRYLGERKEAA